MIILLTIIVLTVLTQNSLQEYINTECHPHRTRGIVCRDKTMDSSEGEENGRIIYPRGFQHYQGITRESTSEEDLTVTASYEGMRKLSDKMDNSKIIDKLKSKHYYNYQGAVDEFHNDESVNYINSKKQGDVSVAIDKSDNVGEVGYKSPENLRNFLELPDVSDSGGNREFESFKHLRNYPKQRGEGAKSRTLIKKDHWKFKPNNFANKDLQKRFLPGLIVFAIKQALWIGAGEVVQKVIGK